MKFTLGWLKEYLETDAALDEICARCTKIGLEVEEVVDPSAEMKDLWVAELKEVRDHPNSDHLRVLKVWDGRAEYQIVCGAPNCRPGLKSVLALPGTIIPESGKPLTKGVIRGIESRGMMCSARELKLGSDHTGIIELPDSFKIGEPFRGLGAGDPVIDINVTPNRMDCLGVYGIARDLAASGLGKLKPMPKIAFKAGGKSPIRQESTSPSCPILHTRYVRGIDNSRKTPQWMKDRLEAVGYRPISPAVDVTNYMTVAYNRPLHCFDAAHIKDVLAVRDAAGGETFQTLDGKKHRIEPGMTLFYDAHGPLSIAGVMGGISTACSDRTTDVVLEAGWFAPEAVARTGRKLNINSDARYHFERGIDPKACEELLDMATQLLVDMCGGAPSEVQHYDVYEDVRKPIKFSAARFRQHIAVDLPQAKCEDYLRAIGCIAKDGGWLPPSWRLDISTERDLFEEVIRLYGYEHIPALPLPFDSLARPVLTKAQKTSVSVRRNLAGRGLLQCLSYSFTSSKIAALFGGKGAKLANPISPELDEMRPSVLCSLMTAVRNNADRGYPDLALFELGPAFHGSRPFDQQEVAGIVRSGHTRRNALSPARQVDAYDVKADALAALAAAEVAGIGNLTVSTDGLPPWYHPGRAGAIVQGSRVFAYFGDIHPAALKSLDIKIPVVAAEVFVELGGTAKHGIKGLDMHDLQPVSKDLAFVVDKTVPADKLAQIARGAEKKLVAAAEVFDVYEGDGLPDGKKSVAVAVTIQPEEKPLTDEEIEGVMRKIEASAAKNAGAVLRG